MGFPARAVPVAAAPVEHCSTCICNPGSPRAIEYMSRIEPVKIPREVRWLITIMGAEFFEWLFAWWKESKGDHGRHRPRAEVHFIAHPSELLTVSIWPRPRRNKKCACKTALRVDGSICPGTGAEGAEGLWRWRDRSPEAAASSRA